MEGLLILFVPILLLILFFLQRGAHSESGAGFAQANVSVSYDKKTITTGGRTFPVDAVRGIRWRGGLGKYGNQSEAVIELSDMRYPRHKISFIRSADAEKFCTRLSIAIEKAGGPVWS